MEGVTGQQQAHKNMHAGIDFAHMQGQSQGQSHAQINPPKDFAREAEEIMDFLKTIRLQHRVLRDCAESYSQHEAAQILSSCNDNLLAFCLANKRKFMPEAGQRTMKLEKDREEDHKLIQHLEAKVAKLDKELKEALKTKESALNSLKVEDATGKQQAQKNMHAGIDFAHLQGHSQGQFYARINPPKDVAREADEIMTFLKTIRIKHKELRDSAESYSQQQAAQIFSSCNDNLLAFCLANRRKFMPEAGQRTMKLEKDREEDQKLIQYLEAKVAKLEREIREALKTKESALNRLSEVQSRLLKQGNPEIAELSDWNRPTNLGRRFKQLYEDEWTDAFECLTENRATDLRVEDHTAIGILNEMLKRCKELCAKEQAAQHLELAKLVTDKCFFKPDLSKTLPNRPESSEGQSKAANHGGKNTQPGTKRSSQMSDVYDAGQMPETPRTSTVADVHKIPEQYNTLFKEFFKGIADETLKYLPMTELVVEINKDGVFQHDILQNPEIRTYLQKCFNICWLMLAQHPPMLMDFETRSGHTLDINVFEPYSSRGPIISQVVWPPVYLHKGGLLVCKGYAEGSKKQ